MRNSTGVGVVAIVAILAATPALAQDGLSVQPYIGMLVTDGPFDGVARLDLPGPPPPPADLDTTVGVLVGARVGWEMLPGWTIEGSYGHSSYSTELTTLISTVIDPVPREVTLEFTEHTAHLYYGAIRYDFVRGAVEPFLSLGAGGVTTSTSFGELDELDTLFGLESVSDPLLVLGGGLTIEVAPRTRVRGDIKDLVRFCSADFCGDDETLHNVEVSGGIEIAF